MEKIILTDNTEIEIKAGASLGAITATATDFTALGVIATALTAPGNMDSVKFKTGDTITGEYADMKLESPLFRTVDIVGDRVEATFAIREKTEVELAIEELRAGQEVQDGAITDLGDVVSTIVEGGIQ
ncbi:hypothetical protein EAI89_06745 [Eubacterium sp. am_0171]|uniref:Uncharacterized protein n=1 Tax=Faecalicatena contorta TaxID=39482 RepID=A0A174CLU2_9FIRM|nr:MULTISPECIES: hypothetical protein [Clostridia]MSC84346.1 hypothetical protein [Eubacterium sp. BIOML-A1]MSD05892.1 hypothetical protein [Eubacterium sp. BIOML-A2]RYT23264.1 hypothetical protein EAI89_06745 [Eubacterium sp. am_0171]CUO13847.1 Uncharacterised protein [[Eubacterium] contortum] [Faecalicatena contorta]